MLSIEEIVLMIEKLEKLRGTDFDRLIDDNLKILKDLQKVVDTNNAKLSGSREKTVGWFTRDLANKRNKQRNLLLERTIQLKIYQFSKANIYSSLEIGPGNGDFSMDFRKWKSNYFVDVIPGYEKTIRSKFPPAHQKYLNFLKTEPEQADLSVIPSNAINFVFSWDTFVFFDQKLINEYLEKIYGLLVPGGFCFIQYADCHYDLDLTNAKNGYWRYNNKNEMSRIIEGQGYRIIEMNQFCPGANFAIFQKPGNQKTQVYKISEITLD